MTKWKSQINGAKLRKFTNEDESWEVLKELLNLLENINRNLNKFSSNEYDMGEFEDLLARVKDEVEAGEGALISYVEGEDWIEDVQDYVNGFLTEFYDLCDSSYIWVTME